MAESIAERVAAALEQDLAAIAGDGGATYWHTPRVISAPAFTSECLDSSVGDPATIYVIVPGDEETSRPAAFDGVRIAELPVDVVLAQRFLATENPFRPPDPSRRTVQNRLLQDAEKGLFAGTQLEAITLAGGRKAVIGADVPVKDRSPENTFVEGWAVAFMHIRIQYQYSEIEP